MVAAEVAAAAAVAAEVAVAADKHVAFTTPPMDLHPTSSPTAGFGHDAAADLLARIEAFGFDVPDDPLGFESRLADDQGWTLGYALAVVAEYRRFLVLTQVAGHAVSPSRDVDEAWHLHLTRTAHYEAFCAAVFGRFLHHEPAESGEGARHRDMYRETRQDYQRIFGARAPSVIWPAQDKREQPRAPPAVAWSVPYRLRGPRLAGVVVLGAIALGLLLRDLGLLTPLQDVRPLSFLAAGSLVTVALGALGLRGHLPPMQVTQRDTLDPYEAAWFSGGARRMAMTAIVMLTERGILLAPGRPSERGQRPPIPVNMTVEARAGHPAEVACLSAAAEGGVRFTAACDAMRPLAAQVERRLVAAGIAGDAGALPWRRAWALLALAVLLAVEFERIFRALGSPHPVGFLAVLTYAGVVLGVVLARPPRGASTRSERALRPLRMQARRYRKTPPVGEALAFGVALVGGAVLADDLRFDGLKQQVYAGGMAGLARRKGGASGCSGSSCSACGSSDSGGGGSSCGSSCAGGCGGGGGD